MIHKNKIFANFSLLIIVMFFSCKKTTKETVSTDEDINLQQTSLNNSKSIKKELPTIGLLMYNGVLTTEVTAAADVFTKYTEDNKQLFNVITIAENKNAIVTEEGLQMIADYTFSDCPELQVLFVPSAYDMSTQVKNKKIITFIQNKDKETQYTVSNCAGAQLIGASGIADGKKIVTWIGGGEQLQKDYPNLIVENDSLVAFVEDGKYSSSNGNLVTYISALNLLEKMTNKGHRKYVESYLYLNRLKNY